MCLSEQSYSLFMLVHINMDRVCSKCFDKKPLNESFFSKNQSTNTGGDKYFRPECKVCSSKERRGCQLAKKRAGRPERPVLGTACDNCGRTDRKLVFDHCHVTLAHRGWLCDNCNRSAGMLGDDVAGLVTMLNYINKTERRDLIIKSNGELSFK